MRFGDTLILEKGKDGGPESKVDGFWIFRHKKLFTLALLRFNKGSREAYHSHAFNSISWLLTGGLRELQAMMRGDGVLDLELNHTPGVWPIVTLRSTMHKVYGEAEDNWVLTFRGPWADTWCEMIEDANGDLEIIKLTHNRVRVELP